MSINEMPKVIVLMCTYNGEDYLGEQLESLLYQTYPNFSIIIRDDASTDGTIEILKRFAARDKRVVLELSDINIGYPACFYALTDNAPEADYYFFADQDDVWFPEKIERAVHLMRREPEDEPVAYYSGYQVCDEKLHVMEMSPAPADKFCLTNTMFQVCGLEFTMGINRCALQLLQDYKPVKAKARGMWMSMLYGTFGKVIYEDVPTANYRRHSSAVTSVKQSGIGFWLWRINFFWKGGEFDLYKLMLEDFYDVCGSRLNEEDKKELQLFAKEHGFVNNVKKAFYHKRLRNKWIDELALRFVLLIGKI